MNNEIKEILECMKNYGSTTELALLDYITNLQQENERLKEENKYLDELRNANYLSWQDSLSRIEKAVEYMKSKEDSLFISFSDNLLNHDELINKKIEMTLLNILNGRSDE